jgi:hypothetical protein
MLVLVLMTLGGCARWEARWEKVEAKTGGIKFPKGRLSPDSVVLEIAIAQLDDSQTLSFEEFWSSLDQQKLELSVRQRIDQNGLRAAIMASYVPATMQRLIEPRPVELESLDLVEQQMAEKSLLEPKPRVLVHQRITNHDGEKYPIQTSEVFPEFSWTVRCDGLESFTTGKLVRGIFEIVTLPQGDGSVRLRITPQVHHGVVRPTIGVAERAFFFDSMQSVNRISELTLDVTMRPGETLVIAPTADVQDLGELFFGMPAAATGENNTPGHLTHRMLMVRVVQTQLDDLFGNSANQAKLTTTSRQ